MNNFKNVKQKIQKQQQFIFKIKSVCPNQEKVLGFCTSNQVGDENKLNNKILKHTFF